MKIILVGPDPSVQGGVSQGMRLLLQYPPQEVSYLTAVGGVPELIQHGHTGLLVSPNDQAALSQTLQLLIEDASLRTPIGQAARDHARTHFDIAVMVRAYEQFYSERLLQPSRTSR